MILNFDGHPPMPLAGARPAYAPRPMGPATRVRSAIDTAIADVDWSDPAHGVLDDHGAPYFEIDLGKGDDATLDGFIIHVRGPLGAADLIAHLCLVNGWAALDCAQGMFLDLEQPERWGSTRRAAQA